jgi:hypothetical protein
MPKQRQGSSPSTASALLVATTVHLGRPASEADGGPYRRSALAGFAKVASTSAARARAADPAAKRPPDRGDPSRRQPAARTVALGTPDRIGREPCCASATSISGVMPTALQRTESELQTKPPRVHVRPCHSTDVLHQPDGSAWSDPFDVPCEQTDSGRRRRGLRPVELDSVAYHRSGLDAPAARAVIRPSFYSQRARKYSHLLQVTNLRRRTRRAGGSGDLFVWSRVVLVVVDEAADRRRRDIRSAVKLPDPSPDQTLH